MSDWRGSRCRGQLTTSPRLSCSAAIAPRRATANTITKIGGGSSPTSEETSLAAASAHAVAGWSTSADIAVAAVAVAVAVVDCGTGNRARVATSGAVRMTKWRHASRWRGGAIARARGAGDHAAPPPMSSSHARCASLFMMRLPSESESESAAEGTGWELCHFHVERILDRHLRFLGALFQQPDSTLERLPTAAGRPTCSSLNTNPSCGTERRPVDAGAAKGRGALRRWGIRI